MAMNNPPGSPGTASPDAQQFGQQFNYNPSDPTQAFNNAMRESGYNPNAYNPYMDYMRRQAPGLSLAYQQRAAMGAYGDPQAAAQNPGNYRNFLVDTISGVNGGGYNQLHQAAAYMPQVINQARAQGTNSNLQQVNPYLYALGQNYGGGTDAATAGQGTTGAYASFYAPFMNQPTAQAYGTGLEQARQNAMYQYGQHPQMGRDIWSYLLGY